METRKRVQRSHVHRALCAGVIFISSACLNQTLQADDVEYPYAVIQIHEYSEYLFYPSAINDNGLMAGISLSQPALFSRKDGVRLLDTLGGSRTAIYDLNNRGIAVGMSRNHCYNRPVVWTKNGIEDLLLRFFPNECRYGVANAINDNGQIVGEYFDEDAQTSKAFVIDGDEFRDLSFLRNESEARDINQSGDICGNSGSDHGSAAVLWRDGKLIELPRFHEGDATWANGMNDLGYVVGRMLPERRGSGSWAFMWDPDLKPHNLHVSGHPINVRQSRALAINNNLQVVGTAWGPWDDEYNRERRGFIWDPKNRMRILDRLFPPFCSLVAIDAYDINDQGEILASGQTKYGSARSLVVTPVDPEMALNTPDGPIRADAINTWTVTGAQPGARITLVYGKEGGGHYVPSCNALKAMLQIADPVPFIRATADNEGKATFEVMVPPRAAVHKGFLIQAVDFHNCEESQLVLKKVE